MAHLRLAAPTQPAASYGFIGNTSASRRSEPPIWVETGLWLARDRSRNRPRLAHPVVVGRTDLGTYNREDQAVARRFAEAFEAAGFDVWWDTTLRAGEAYDEVTETALRTAKAVVVLWSPRSVVSRLVRAGSCPTRRRNPQLRTPPRSG
eukprot:gene69210-94862_t